jgi:hemerythrin
MLWWKNEYIIGISQIDEQHEKLFEIANRIYELIKNDLYLDKYDKILSIIDELREYTIFHFKAEEDYMLSIGYKKLLSHKVEHNDFIEKINNVDLKKIDQDQDKYILEILEFVVDWIGKHILEKDKLIAAN